MNRHKRASSISGVYRLQCLDHLSLKNSYDEALLVIFFRFYSSLYYWRLIRNTSRWRKSCVSMLWWNISIIRCIYGWYWLLLPSFIKMYKPIYFRPLNLRGKKNKKTNPPPKPPKANVNRYLKKKKKKVWFRNILGQSSFFWLSSHISSIFRIGRRDTRTHICIRIPTCKPSKLTSSISVFISLVKLNERI